MADKAPSTWSLVVVPAVLSLVVSILRLVGELQGWNEILFGTVGPDGKQGVFGISWLIPVFGFWFGFKLRRITGAPPHAGKAALRFAIGAAVMIGGFAAVMTAGLVVMPKADAPAVPSGLGYGLTLAAAAAVIMLTGWTRLAVTLLLYGLLARIPVVVITYLALQNGWSSHYSQLPPGTILPEGTSAFVFLSTPQMTFWLVATMMFGGLAGCLGAALARRR